MTKVAILWHMHQPYYEDLATQEHILPWVRLHALKDYYGMAALTREFPGVKMTFNLVPSLLAQLEAFAAGRARDRDLDLSLKPATELTDADVEYLLENFFHAQRQRMIDVHSRYGELLARRGGALTAADRRAAARRFTADDLRDLQVWHTLAWVDPFYLDGDARVRELVAKGRQFTEEDKQVLRGVELELLNKVIPEYREAAARGQIEISTSPFYHPILPLLCDTDVYLRTHPESRMPRRRFARPGDAAEQIGRALAYHERLFGRRPAGLWPSEGSISDAVVPIAAAAGIRWMATDELILARSTETTFSRDGHGHLEQPERLYAPYRVTVGGDSVACVFRDHALSDLIGFSYASWPAETAAADFVGRLVEAGRRYRERTGGEEALISVILDGENAWEHFEGGGRPFLRALYRRLSLHPELQTVTVGEGCAAATRTLAGIFPGSWIDANFYIWIGHPDDQRAWSQLADAREALSAASVAPETAARAYEEVLIAEGSDWFWWYGDDHSSEHDLAFDDLFRRHLRHVYQLLGTPIPDELFVSNISSGAAPPAHTPPTALLAPTLDGEATSYFEWLGAGALEIRDLAGAMHQTGGQALMLTLVQYGFDHERLYLRLDGIRPLAGILAEGYELAVKFLQPEGLRYAVRRGSTGVRGSFWIRTDNGQWRRRGPGEASAAAGTVLEIALPFTDLGVAAGHPLAFFVVVSRDGVEAESHPIHRPIEAAVPDRSFAARHWCT